jgi:phytanoyl-CoA hydroxylase
VTNSITTSANPSITFGREPYRVSVEEYIAFRHDGYLVVRGLFTRHEVEELLAHTDDLMHGRIEVEGVPPPPPNATVQEMETRLVRIHMLHQKLEIHERYLLHPRLLDVLEALIGPDVLAMQTMLFLKGPGAQGQGYHQDSYYIPTFPDSLCGAWLALDRADEENGCLRMVAGSQVEPIYPPAAGYGFGNRELADIEAVSNVGGAWNDDEDERNGLRPVASKYAGRETPVVLDPGDAAFFGGHVLHRSLTNRSATRMRRAFVTHYCNARSFTPWLGGNGEHILGRGATTLPFAQPRFGTPCAANRPESSRADDALKPALMVASEGGMEAMPAEAAPRQEY